MNVMFVMQHWKSTANIALLCLLLSQLMGAARADDTDLFQLDSISAPARIMLVVDTSGSMAKTQGADSVPPFYDGDCQGDTTVVIGSATVTVPNAERKICIVRAVLLRFLDPAAGAADMLWPDNFEVGLARYAEPGAVIIRPVTQLGSINDPQSARNQLIQAVNSLIADGRTPLVGSYLEVAEYLIGGLAVSAASRESDSSVWAPDGYDAYRYAGVDLSPQCGLTNNHLVFLTDGESVCEKASDLTNAERANGLCTNQSSNVLFGTLGTRVNEFVTGRPNEYNLAQCGPDSYSDYWKDPTYDSYWGCLTLLSAEMKNHQVNNQNAGVLTHVIAYDMDTADASIKQGMQDWASAGGGRYVEATNAAELAAAFQAISAQQILPGTFVVASGAAGVSQVNRFAHTDELYFSMFTPSSKPFWYGNLKKYFFQVDRDGAMGIYTNPEKTIPAVADGQFLPGVLSEWSHVIPAYYNTNSIQRVDGDIAHIGGAASQIGAPDTRRLFVYYNGTRYRLTPNVSSQSGQDIDQLMTAISADYAAALPDPTGADAAVLTQYNSNLLTPAMDWLVGVDVNDEWLRISQSSDPALRPDSLQDERPDPYNDLRDFYGAPLHSSPVLINFRSFDGDGQPLEQPQNLVFVSTNDGKLYVVDASSGAEQLAYMPEAMLKRGGLDTPSPLERMYLATRADAADGKLIYGLDSNWSVWRQDVDNNGNIDAGSSDFVYLYGGMRRGGRNYYILDATDVAANHTIAEKAVLHGGVGPFLYNGQSWSEPQLAIINYAGTPTAVFVVGGGYDPVYDAGRPDILPAAGAQVYIISARDFVETGTGTAHSAGEVLWWASSRTGITDPTHVQIPALQYSIPSTVKTVDVDGDGYLDFFYVADMGGQLLRFDINAQNSAPANLIANTGDIVVAQLGIAGADSVTTANDRRFFYPPSVAKMRCPAGFCMGIAIGSGWRSNPTDTGVTEKFYFLMDYEPFAGNQPVISEAATSADGVTPLILSIPRTDNADAITASSSSTSVRGYSLALGGTGMEAEKLLGSPLILGGSVYFSTYYRPSQQTTQVTSADSCQVGQGAAAIYRFTPGDGQALQLALGQNQNVAGSIQALLTQLDAAQVDVNGDGTLQDLPPTVQGGILSGTGAIGPTPLPLDVIRKTRWMQLE